MELANLYYFKKESQFQVGGDRPPNPSSRFPFHGERGREREKPSSGREDGQKWVKSIDSHTTPQHHPRGDESFHIYQQRKAGKHISPCFPCARSRSSAAGYSASSGTYPTWPTSAIPAISGIWPTSATFPCSTSETALHWRPG